MAGTEESNRRARRRWAALGATATAIAALLFWGCAGTPAAGDIRLPGRHAEAPWWERIEVVVATTVAPGDPPPACSWVVPGDVLFDIGDAVLREPGAVDRVAVELAGSAQVQVVGHTDSTGSDEANVELSERRARSVADRLIVGGVSAERVTVAGKGEGEPRADETGADPDAARSLNRRVEIVGVCS